MADHLRTATRAVVDIATQLRRIADHLTTPANDDIDAPTTTADDAPFTETDPHHPAYQAVYAYIRALGNDMPPSRIERNAMIWRAVHAALGAAPADQPGAPDLRALHQAAEEDATHWARQAMQAATERDQLRATLAEVLSHFVHEGHPGEPCLQTRWVSVRAVEQWRAVLQPPATEEQPYDTCRCTGTEAGLDLCARCPGRKQPDAR